MRKESPLVAVRNLRPVSRLILMAGIIGGITIWPGGAARAAGAEGETGDRQAVREAAGQFYVALNALFTGDVGPMQEVWSHADDVTYMGPGGGLQVGWQAVSANWKRQAAMKLGGRVEPAQMQISVGPKLAVTQNYEKGQNTVGGKVQKVSIRATNVFRKEGGQWKMIAHHTDLLGFLEK